MNNPNDESTGRADYAIKKNLGRFAQRDNMYNRREAKPAGVMVAQNLNVRPTRHLISIIKNIIILR